MYLEFRFSLARIEIELVTKFSCGFECVQMIKRSLYPSSFTIPYKLQFRLGMLAIKILAFVRFSMMNKNLLVSNHHRH